MFAPPPVQTEVAAEKQEDGCRECEAKCCASKFSFARPVCQYKGANTQTQVCKVAWPLPSSLPALFLSLSLSLSLSLLSFFSFFLIHFLPRMHAPRAMNTPACPPNCPPQKQPPRNASARRTSKSSSRPRGFFGLKRASMWRRRGKIRTSPPRISTCRTDCFSLHVLLVKFRHALSSLRQGMDDDDVKETLPASRMKFAPLDRDKALCSEMKVLNLRLCFCSCCFFFFLSVCVCFFLGGGCR